MCGRWLLSLVVIGLLVTEVQGTPPVLSHRPLEFAPKSPVPAPQARVLVRQGGDTMATATPIASFPYVGSGTTAGYTNDYDTICPQAGSSSPDVVYSFTRPEYGTLTIDLCGSSYDTKIYVMSEAGQIFDCNDDFYSGGLCGQHTSKIENLWLPPGETYYLVIDGAGDAAGDYTFEMRRWGADPAGDGDTLLNPLVINAIPFTGGGTTANYTNDYDEVCPYSGSTAPDVVYKYVATSTVYVDIDLCFSSYDTKIYVYDAGLNLVACNDDFYFGAPCFVYSSKLENIPFNAGNTYYIIIDGYGNTSGAYILDIDLAAGPCILTCPAGSVFEGEPPLVPNYVDNFNGGCNSPPGNPFWYVSSNYYGNAILCGVSGWYTVQGGQRRDTDWYILTMGYAGNIEITLDAEYPTYMFELGPRDCATVGVIQNETGGPCNEAFMTIGGPPHSPVWFWVGSTVFAPPPGAGSMYDYIVWFSGLESNVTTETTTWSTLKALYR